MSSPLFSCVVPVKGARPFIADALASLESQGMGEELEIIVQDGGVGSGGVGEFVSGGVESGGVRYYREDDNGQSDALNKGFAKAKGEWLFWLNADDVLLPGALKRVLDRINRIDRIEWITGNQLLIDDAGKVLKCSVGNGWHDWLYRNAVPHVYGPSAFYRRELFEKVGGFDVNLKYCMDWDVWIKFMKTGAKFFRINDYLWAQRQWSGSKTQRKVPKDEVKGHWDEIGAMLDKNGMNVTWLGNLRVRMWRLMNGNVLRQCLDGIRFKGSTVGELCL